MYTTSAQNRQAPSNGSKAALKSRPLFCALFFLLCSACPVDSIHGETLENEKKSISVLPQYDDPKTDSAGDPVSLLCRFSEPKRAYDLILRNATGEQNIPIAFSKARLLTELGLYERADSALHGTGFPMPLRWTGLLSLWRARLNLLSGKQKAALQHLHSIESGLPAYFEPYRDILRIEALFEAGEQEEAISSGTTFLSVKKMESLENRLYEILFNAYLSSDSLEQAAQIARGFDGLRLDSREASRLYTKEIDLYYQLGDTALARDKTLELARKFPSEPATIDVVRRKLDRFSQKRLTTGELIFYGEMMIRSDRLQEAKRILSHLRKRNLNQFHLEQIRILLANLYYREKKYSQAAELARLKYETPSLKRYSMLILARCYRRMGRPASAAALYKTFASTFPNDFKAAEALFVSFKLYKGMKRSKSSLRVLELLAEKYRSSYFGRIAILELASRHLQNGRHSKSAAILEQALERSRWTDEAVFYYLAETYEKSGETNKRDRILNELESLDPFSFYLKPGIESVSTHPPLSSNGTVEIDESGEFITFLREVAAKRKFAQEKILASLPTPRRWERYENAVNHLERGRAFLEMGFRDWAEDELDAVEAIFKTSKRLTFELAVFCDQHGFAWKSVKLYQNVWDKIHGQERLNLEGSFRILLYPLPFPVQVLENCARQGLAPHLVYAMIREESMFDLTAVSRAGAKGLMQLMPGTGRHVAQQLDLPEEIGENLFAPDINLAFGIWYASYLLRKCGGDPLMMLAAYNAGLSNAKKWFPRRRMGQPKQRIVDGISFKETRTYVKKIVESSNVYRALYFNPPSDNPFSKREWREDPIEP